ncbi:MAG: hypothetical protein KDA41_09495 [Planctomycetales bacterium]|nr:hypothetical protein [Planctomycetales bacterium]
MAPSLRTLLIGLLVVVLGRAPVPWVHRHDGMTREQLALHLQQCHHGCPASCAPSGWHCHLIQLAAPVDVADLEELESLASLRRIGDPRETHAAPHCFLATDGAPQFASSPPAVAALDEANAALSRLNLFMLYQSLLI